MNAFITVGLSKLPYWVRLHFVSANSMYQILQEQGWIYWGRKKERQINELDTSC